MLAVIRLEIIADNYYAGKKYATRETRIPDERYRELLGPDKSRPWVARITGLDAQFGYKREFMRGQKDYSQANSVGSRGVYMYYPLSDGIYEVHERLSWKRTRRYFCQVSNSDITEISREEVNALLCQQG